VDSEIIYARDLGVKSKLMVDYYPEREYYLTSGSDIQEVFSFYYDGTGEPTVTNSDFETRKFNG